jgi:putative copper resistance protein D
MTMSALLPPLTFARAFTMWLLHPWAAVVLTVLLAGYLTGIRAARRRGSGWSAVATASWLGGIFVLTIATQGSPAVYGDDLFWMHMVAHLLLVMVAPVLLLLGRPLDLALAAVSPERAARLRSVLEGRVVSVLVHPGVGLALYGGVIVGTHLTGFMNATMMHTWLRGAEQWMYVIAGTIFFLPLIGNQPIRWKLANPLKMAIYVVAMPIDTFTGLILGQTNKYPWPMMAAMHPSWAPSLIADLHAGGAIMWVGGDAIMAVMFGAAAFGWARAAGAGDGSELGGWLSAARANYHADLLGAQPEDETSSAVGHPPRSPAAPDSDDALEAYNAYLDRLSRN